MFARLATLVTRHWLLVLAIWLVIPIALKLAAPSWDDICQDGDFAYLPPEMTSSRGEELFDKAFPDQTSKSEVVLVVARPNGRLRQEDYDVASRLAEKFAPREGAPVTAVYGYDEPVVGRKLVSPLGRNGQAVLVVLQLNTEFMVIDNIEYLKEVYGTLDTFKQDESFPGGLQLGVTGSAAIGSDMLASAEESIDNTELATTVLVVLILLVVYRAPGLVIVPLLAVTTAYVVSTNLIALLAEWGDRTGWYEFRVFKTTEIFIVVILFGAATDYCLFLIARYREEMQRGLAPAEAIREALARTGHALTASAMTTILGLGAMIFADFGKYRCGGPTIALSLVVALVVCVTAAPALLRAVGRRVFWPFGVGPPAAGNAALATGLSSPQRAEPFVPEPASGPMGRFWQALARLIVTHPGLILAGSFLLLAVPAYHGLSVGHKSAPLTYDLLSELPEGRGSVHGTRLLAEYFALGQMEPIGCIIYRPGYDFDTPAQRRQIAALTKELAEFEYVDSHGQQTRPILAVRSLTNPLGDPMKRKSGREIARDVAVQKDPRAKAMFLSTQPDPKYPQLANAVIRFELVSQYDPFSAESILLLDAVDNWLLEKAKDPASPWLGTSFDYTGTTAGIRDLKAVNTSDTKLIGILVALAVLGVLVLLLRRPVISLYLIFTVLLGFFVSLGLTQIFFAWFYGDSFQGLDWKLPVFLFVILVAVGEDYNIYLVTRVEEEQRRWGVLEGIRVAVIRTGGIITSCGVIMAGTFASMLSGTLRGMIQLGFALALGVLLDTFIIRTILVPSFLALWDRRFARVPQGGSQSPAHPHFDAVEAPAGPSLAGRRAWPPDGA
jgi:RND superfamily putative drug exporter